MGAWTMNRRVPGRQVGDGRFAGRGRLTVESLEPRCMLDGASLVHDAFTAFENSQPAPLDVLANDIFDAAYAGPRRITMPVRPSRAMRNASTTSPVTPMTRNVPSTTASSGLVFVRNRKWRLP